MRPVHKLPALWVPALALLLGGCAHLRPAPEPVAERPAPEAPAAWQAAADQPAGAVRVGWIESFQDPALVDLVAEAQANNEDLHLAAAAVERAWALARQADAAFAPEVDLAAGAGHAETRGGSGDGTSLDVGFQASWELDLWGRLRAGRRAAAESAEAAAADYRYAQHSLAAAVARSYFVAVEAELQEAAAQDEVGALTETNRVVEVQYQNGLALAQDLSLARSDLAAANERLAAAQGRTRGALRDLEVVLGRYPRAALQVRSSLPAVPAPPPPGLPSGVLERRPDLVAAERRIAAARGALDQAKAARLPEISLTASGGGASSSLSGLLDPGNLVWQAASSLLVPLLDGDALEAQVEAAAAARKQAVAAYARTALTAFAEVEQLLDEGAVLTARRAALAQALQEAGNALRLAEVRLGAGEGSLLDVLTIRRRVTDTRRSLLTLQRVQLDRYVNLNLALGGEWQSPAESAEQAAGSP